MMQQFPHRHRSGWFVLSIVTSVVVATYAWNIGANSLFPLAVLPIVWAWCSTWWQRYFSALVYALISLWPIEGAIRGFFSGTTSEVGHAGWLAFAAVWAIPFVVIAAGSLQSGRRAVVAFMVLALTIVPPLGVLAWCHPVLAAGWVIPGGGAASLVALVGVWAVLTAVQFRWAAVTALCLILVGYLQADRVDRLIDPLAQKRVAAIDTRVEIPTNIPDLASHVVDLASSVSALPRSASIVVTPETTLANWREATKVLVDFHLAELAQTRSLILGATFTSESSSGSTERYGGALLLGPDGAHVHRARQPLPFSLWRPWDADGHHAASWGEPGVHWLQGIPVGIRICSEEMSIFWSALDSVVGPKPAVVVGLVNAWWVNHPSQLDRQLRHARAGAALLGVPLIRAINAPVKQPWLPATEAVPR